jgi:hypothetical protein
MDPHSLTLLLSDPKLSDRAKVMGVVLSQTPNASAEQLAQAAGHRRRKAQLALRELIQQGLVEAQYHRRQVRYRLKALCGQLDAECGKSATNPAICARSCADRTILRERSCADPPAPDARTRTLWSSSSEEDSFCTPLSVPSPPGGGAGGDSKVIHISLSCLAPLQEAWAPIAPGMPCPREWFQRLCSAFGLEIPLRIFRQFALSERTLKDLKHPQNYKSYFTRCCYTEHQRQATPTPGREDLGEEDAQFPDLLSHYEHKRRNRPCATR